MELRVHRADEHVTHLALIGRLDLAGIQAVEMAFVTHTASRHKPTIVEMTEVTYLSSLGVRMLLGAAKAVRGRGHVFVLFNPQEIVLQVLQIGGIESVMAIEYDLERALAAAGVPATAK